MITVRSSAGLAMAVLLAGCSNGFETQTLDLPSDKTLLTSAEIRAVHRTRVGGGSRPGKVEPAYITCAEPSPDVAKAFSQSFDTSLTAAVSNPAAGIDPKLAAAVSVARAQALAQLGERLATIQLLRDGLYRACEAYANGALSDASYAVLLSRADDAMVTMLLGEIAGGAFGRSLAALGTGAEGRASASFDAEQTSSSSREAENSLDRALNQKNAAQTTLAAAEATGDPGAVQEAQESVKEASKAVEQAQSAFKQALKAEAESSAKALFVTAAGGITPGQPQPAIADMLQTMQRKYIENIHFDAVELACMTALDRPASEETGFSQLCKGALLPSIQKHKGELLQAILKRHWDEVDAVAKHHDAQEAFAYASQYLAELKKISSEQ